MSSYVCSPEHFNSIAKAAESALIWEQNFHFWNIELIEAYPELKRPREFKKATKTFVEKMVDTLRDINALCVSLQYKHHYVGKLDEEIESQKQYTRSSNKSKHLTKHGLFKALQCLDYQIEIVHLEELRELTDDEKNAMLFLDKFKDAMAHHIVSYSSEYDQAAWEVTI